MARFARRALLRAAVSGAVAAAPALPWRRRPGVVVAAAGGAAVMGSAVELPQLAPPVGAALLVALVRSGAEPASSAVAAAGGATVAFAVTRVWPVAPRTPAQVRRTNTRVESRPAPDGEGLAVVVNPAAGSALQRSAADLLRERLPGAAIIEVGDDCPLDVALARATEADVVGIAGGDGSINAAAGVARAADKPLFVVPAGTLNHFARDLGVTGVDDAVEALRDGDAVAVDTGTIDGKPFLNTASFGTYSDLVDARERLEGTIGKWPALVVALVGMLRRAEPMEVEIDGRRRRLWMAFVGNCTYSPPGFAPAWRERLDDGWLDVRLVDASRPLSRARLLAAVLTGRLAKTAVYEAFRIRELHVRCVDGPLRLARDGETFDGSREFTVRKGAPIRVYAPPPPS